GGGARASHSRRGCRRVRRGRRADALLRMGRPQRDPRDSGRQRPRRTPTIALGDRGGDNNREVLAAPPTTVLDRLASRRGGSVPVRRGGGAKGLLVCLRSAGGTGRLPTSGETGLGDSPAARASPPRMNR